MTFLSFIFASIYDWFYRDGNPRNQKSFESSEERAVYVMTVGFLIWLICLDAIFSILYLKTRLLYLPKYFVLILAAVCYFLLRLFYLKDKAYVAVYEKYKSLYGSKNRQKQLMALSILIILPVSIFTILMIYLH